MVVFIWNELERQSTHQQKELAAKKAKDDDFAQSLQRFDQSRGKKLAKLVDRWSPWSPGDKTKKVTNRKLFA